MTIKCHNKTISRLLGYSVVLALVCAHAPLWAQKKPEISFDAFDQSEDAEAAKPKKKREAAAIETDEPDESEDAESAKPKKKRKAAAMETDESESEDAEAAKPKRKRKAAATETDESGASEDAEATKPKKRALPTIDELMDAKREALDKKLAEQKELLAEIDRELETERAIERKALATDAYLALSIINSAPPADYELQNTRVELDGSLLAKGGKRNNGLPRTREIFFGKVSPGCHEVKVYATYVRLKNDLISRFKVERKEKLVAWQTVIARPGERLVVEIEGFEKQHTLLSFFRGPEVRFNKSVRPNILPGASMIPLNEVTRQGRVKIDYVTQDTSTHRLLEKSISIDGLPILRREKHDETNQGSVVFDAPLSEGEHFVDVTLVFAEKKWVGGSPNFNLTFKFERKFFVMAGKVTEIGLEGLPEGGINSRSDQSRYARASSEILSEDEAVFPKMSCKDIEKAQEEARKKAEEEAKKAEEEALKAAEEAAKAQPGEPAPADVTDTKKEPEAPVPPVHEGEPSESKPGFLEGKSPIEESPTKNEPGAPVLGPVFEQDGDLKPVESIPSAVPGVETKPAEGASPASASPTEAPKPAEMTAPPVPATEPKPAPTAPPGEEPKPKGQGE